AAEAVLRGNDKLAYVELAYELLRVAPALGVVAAGACLGGATLDADPDGLVEEIEQLRDRWNLAPTDPAWSVLDVIAPKKSARKRRGGDDPADDGDDKTQRLD